MDFKVEDEDIAIPEHVVRSWYRKSHDHYEPSEQITRDYEEPFDKTARFGRPPRGSVGRVKRLLTWFNPEPVTLIGRQQADFIERTKSSVGRVKDREASRIHADAVHGKKSTKDEFDASDALRESNLDEKIVFLWRCLQDLSIFRQKLKKRIPEVPFLDIEDDLSYLDEKCAGVLPENKVFAIIEKHRVCPNKEFLLPLMDTLQLRKDGNVNYRELLNLLNWRYDFPVLSEMKQASSAISDYISTYCDSIGNIQAIDNAKVRAAGIPSKRSDLPIAIVPRAGICPDKENLGDQTSVKCLISPSIFTKHGLTYIDFFKIRDKEEIRSIFENVGFKFPEDSFDVLWQEGLRRDCTGAVCVETFRELLAASDFVAEPATVTSEQRQTSRFISQVSQSKNSTN